jgi:hypothetical protein
MKMCLVAAEMFVWTDGQTDTAKRGGDHFSRNFTNAPQKLLSKESDQLTDLCHRWQYVVG